ncbi:MAG: hypothetical protein K0B05_06575 [Bacteroidales bacterium]|nr:hypothetical protein [Bacteroidales bacterium]
MKNKDVILLLEKYYNGETSEEEESILKEYFSNDNIPEIFREDQEIFEFFLKEKSVMEPSQGFDERLISAIDSQEYSAGKGRIRRMLITITAIAAGLLILFGTWFFFKQNTGPKDTFSDPEIAYIEAMKVLHNVSYRLNSGTRALETVGKLHEITERSLNTINRSTVKIEKNIGTLDQYIKALEDINNLSKQ